MLKEHNPGTSRRRHVLAWALLGAGAALAPLTHAATGGADKWRAHTVYQLNGRAKAIKLPSEYQLASLDWGAAGLVPYLAYMPEKDRLAMLALYEKSGRSPAISFSDDHGTSWTTPTYIGGGGLSLTYLGGGTLLSEAFRSRDYGETWQALPASDNGETWLPALVDRDPATGAVTRVLRGFWRPLRKWAPGLTGPYCQARVKSSYDEGQTWQDEVIPKEWLSVNEVSLVRAGNGDIVAACRMDINKRLEATAMDDYTGMGISISKDNGKTWTSPFEPQNMLYDFGRHHAWMVRLPDDTIVMSYIVRRGYPDSADGLPQFGIEAVVSRDHGATWDLDHRYVLHVYKGTVPAREYMAFQGAPSNASTAVLPDGTLLTAFNMEYTKIGLVKWKLNHEGLNRNRTLAKTRFDADVRNHFDPAVLSGDKPAARPRRGNIAACGRGAKVTASHTDIDPALLLEDPYLYSQFPPGVVFDTSPAWVELSWPTRHRIEEVQILTGDPAYRAEAPLAWVPLDYRLEYRQGDEWVDLVPLVQNAAGTIAYTWHDDSKKPVTLHLYTHGFRPLVTDAIRMTVTRSADTEKQRTFIKRIAVIGK
jgi:hypothetical protein